MADDPVSIRQKQLKLSQKLSEAITNYLNYENYQHGVTPDEFREIYKTLKTEQSTLQDEISSLM